MSTIEGFHCIRDTSPGPQGVHNRGAPLNILIKYCETDSTHLVSSRPEVQPAGAGFELCGREECHQPHEAAGVSACRSHSHSISHIPIP